MTIYEIEIWTITYNGIITKYTTKQAYRNKTEAEKRKKNLNKLLKNRGAITKYYTKIIEIQLY